MKLYRLFLIITFLFGLSGCYYSSQDSTARKERELLTLLTTESSKAKANSTSTTSPTTPTNTANTFSVSFVGKVVDENNSNPINLAEITTNPSITTEFSNASGEFKLSQMLTNGVEYTLIIKKYGYIERTIKIDSVSQGTKDLGTITLRKDTANFQFINVIVKDISGNPLGGAVFNYSGGGVTNTATTDTSGLLSVPVEKSVTSQAFTIVRTGYKSSSGIFDIYTGLCSGTSNAAYECRVGSIIVTMETL
jgi:hypothetical protein